MIHLPQHIVIHKQNIIPAVFCFFLCLISTTSTLINYIIPDSKIRNLLLCISVLIEIYWIIKNKWTKKELGVLIYLGLLAIFPLVHIGGGWSEYNSLYYITSLLLIMLIMGGMWKTTLSFKVMYSMYFFYAMCTILFRFMPDFYKETIVNLFPDTKSRLIAMYNNNCMPGMTSHYSTNGMFLATGFLMAFLFWMISKEKKKRKAFIVFSFLCALLLTGKRAHLLFSVTAVYAVYWIVTMSTKGKNYINRFIKVAGIVLIGILIVFFVLPAIPALSTTLLRIQNSLVEGDIDNGRFLIWDVAFGEFKKSPILGIGWKEFATTYGFALLRKETAYDVHNVYLQLLCETGLFGFTLYSVWFITLLQKGIKQVKEVVTDAKATQQEQFAICFALGYQIFFLLYCITGNPLYDKMTYFPYFLSCGITLYFEKNIK